MKIMKIMKIMKQNTKLYVILIITLSLYSCTTTPIINGEKPFIVNEISTDWLSKDMCKYYGPSTAAGDNLGICTAKPAIITKRGLYNIGDTIKCTK